ncbi:MAG: 5'-nucleotidase C-terminal domain-containing protein [bacterium]
MINSYSDKLPFKGFFTRSQEEKKETANVKIWYINDVHGQLSKMDGIKISSDKFKQDAKNYYQPVDTFLISSGDNCIDTDVPKNRLWIECLNKIGLDYSALGNHELDNGEKGFTDLLERANFKFLSANTEVQKDSPVYKHKDKIVKSDISIQNGHKYGFIGVAPMDLKEAVGGNADLSGISLGKSEQELRKKEKELSELIKHPSPLSNQNITDKFQAVFERLKLGIFKDTVQSISDELDKLKKQGINKIFLVSHLGKQADIGLINEIKQGHLKGIDVILGGHSHDVFKNASPENLLSLMPNMYEKSEQNMFLDSENNIVVVTQAGKNGEYAGLLDVEFDKHGSIRSVGNKLDKIKERVKDPLIQELKDKFLGKNKDIGKLKVFNNIINENQKLENPLASFVADAIKHKAGADIAFFNNSKVRGKIGSEENAEPVQVITKREIEELLPFKNKIYKVELTADEIKQAIDHGASTLSTKPEYLQTSGLKYKLDSNNKVSQIFIEQPDGTDKNLSEYKPTHKFSVAYDGYLFAGSIGYKMLNQEDRVMNIFDWTMSDAVTEYIKNQSEPIEISPQERIKIEN